MFKPIVGEVSVIEHDQLKPGYFSTSLMHQFEQGLHGVAVVVVERVETSLLIALGGVAAHLEESVGEG
jgi:hypothetical protein